MTAIEMYRSEKARHFAMLAPLFREIRQQLSLDVDPIMPRQRRFRDTKVADAARHLRNRERRLAQMRERRMRLKGRDE